MSPILNLSRREFLKAGALAGGGLILGFRIPFGLEAEAATDQFVPNAFLRIDTKGMITVLVPQSDMGQGVLTSFPMIIAEELDADWTQVRFEQAPADKAYTNPIIGMQLTGGSSSVRGFWKPLNEAGAAARAMLVSAAAGAWKVEATSCRTEKGRVLHPANRTQHSLWRHRRKGCGTARAEGYKNQRPRRFQNSRNARHRLDTPVKVRGGGLFGLDVRLPGMLTAVVSRCPVFGGSQTGYDDSATRNVPGVRRVLPIASGVAVVADTFWAAKKGRDVLKVTWDEGPTAGMSTPDITRLFEEAAKTEGPTARNDGDAIAALRNAPRKIEAVYQLPYLAHANMEPMNCTAHVRANACEIWVPTQGQTLAQRVAAKITGCLKPPSSSTRLFWARASADGQSRIFWPRPLKSPKSCKHLSRSSGHARTTCSTITTAGNL